MKAEFYYSQRKYTCSLSQLGKAKELRIKNDRGDILAVQLLVKNSTRERQTFQVGGITIKVRGKYTLGSLPILLSWQWESLRQEILAFKDYPPAGVRKYQTVFFGNKISNSDYQLVKTFLKQWQHPLGRWLLKGEEPASIIDEIRQLRNRVTHHENVFYLWQFEQLRSLIIGNKSRRGILRKIYH